jgi:hypothetical protein
MPKRPRNLTLFGYDSWSGVGHEVDGALEVHGTRVCLEFKAYEQRIMKDQVMSFNEKSMDYFFSMAREMNSLNVYRLFVSDSSLDSNAAKMCYLWGVISVSPDVLPIPVILDYFRDPVWEDRLEYVLLSEAERIFQAFAQPINSRVKLTSKNTFLLTIPSRLDIEEAEDAHLHMSNELLETIESYEPEHFEKIASLIINKIGK